MKKKYDICDVAKNVKLYMAKHLPKYDVLEVIPYAHPEDYYLFAVIAKRNDLDQEFLRFSNYGSFACWTCWNETTQSLHYGHYGLASWEEAAQIINDNYIITRR